MAKQDDFVRITLRLPRDLHESLTQAAGARSLNAEIISRLEASYSPLGSRSLSEIETIMRKIYSDLLRDLLVQTGGDWKKIVQILSDEISKAEPGPK